MPAVNSPKRRTPRDFGALEIGRTFSEPVPPGANPADLVGGMKHSIARWIVRSGCDRRQFKVTVRSRIGAVARIVVKRLGDLPGRRKSRRAA